MLIQLPRGVRGPMVHQFTIYLTLFISLFFTAPSARQMLKQNFRNEVCLRQVGTSLSGPLLKLCREQTDLFLHASQGFHKGLKICRLIFENNRWNCTTHGAGDYQLFGTVMARGEFVFYFLIVAMYEKTKAICLFFW